MGILSGNAYPVSHILFDRLKLIAAKQRQALDHFS
jgi:hypothetical protein